MYCLLQALILNNVVVKMLCEQTHYTHTGHTCLTHSPNERSKLETPVVSAVVLLSTTNSHFGSSSNAPEQLLNLIG